MKKGFLREGGNFGYGKYLGSEVSKVGLTTVQMFGRWRNFKHLS